MAVGASKPQINWGGKGGQHLPPDKSPLAKNLSDFGKFWVSAKGRFAMSIVAGAVGSAYFIGYVCIHNWFLPKYRDTVQLYKNGFMTPLTIDVYERANAALADVKLPEKARQSVKFFSVYGMDMFYAGSTKTVGGVQIGIPRNFSYSNLKSVEKNDIIVEGTNVEWGSEGGQLLQEALVLSENAQKFGIARDICLADTHYVYIKGALGTSAIALYHFLSRNANDMLYGLYKPRSFRMVVYSAVTFFCYGLWAVGSDILTKSYENSADKRTGNINLNYAKGGVEFYCKILQRNIALRSLMGQKGESLYTFFGNDVEFIREKHVPFTKRKHNLEKIAEQLAVGGGESSAKSTNNNASADPHFLKS